MHIITLFFSHSVMPPSPEDLTIHFSPRSTYNIRWRPPTDIEYTGGIGGYSLTVIGDCGRCKHTGRVSSSVTQTVCEWEVPDGRTCSFTVQTISQDCDFYSTPANYSVIVDGKLN